MPARLDSGKGAGSFGGKPPARAHLLSHHFLVVTPHVYMTDNGQNRKANNPEVDRLLSKNVEAVYRIERSAGQQPERPFEAAAVVIPQAYPQQV